MHTRERSGNAITMHRWIAPVLSLLVTYFFFAEYLSRRVYLPFDMPLFHYPLADYAFRAIRHGRFPEWDPTMYGGMPFAANPQAALFYPGTWLMFAANWHRQHLSYRSLEILAFAHVWIAWMLCFAWLRRHLGVFASICGAAIFAYSGYMMMQLQHLGVIIGYAWIPLGLAGIDQAAESRSWRPLWKVAAASALAFLGGYTPTWFVVATCLVGYAACRRGGFKQGLQCAAAIGASMAVAMIQLLPTIQLSSLRVPEARYGLGIRDPAFYISYLIPNFYDFGLHVDVLANPGREYLYLGVPGIVGLALLMFLRNRSGGWSAAPLAWMFAICAVIVTNPFGIVLGVVRHSMLLEQICRDYYFLAGLTAAAAPLAAIGIDRFLSRPGRASPKVAALIIVCLIAFSMRLLYTSRTADFAPGWAGAWDVTILALLFLAGLWLLRVQRGPLGIALGVALLVTMGIDYKVQGTPKRVNASRDFQDWTSDGMRGMNADVYRELKNNSVYRLVLDQTGPLPADLRHVDLTTPQGFDPFLTAAYKKFIETTGKFRTNWEFEIDPSNESGLRALGIGYFITSAQGPQFGALKADARFRLLQPDDSFYKVFARTEMHPPYGFDRGDATIERTRWEPERREFIARARSAGRFYLSEQWNSGWSARVDGHLAAVERWNGAFQSVQVQPGEHRVEFEFRDMWLRAGAFASLVAVIGLFAACKRAKGAARGAGG